MDNSMCNGIFVYGTLMSGFENYELYLAGNIITVQPAKIKGRLFHLPEGYPAVVAGDGWVRGEFITVRNISSILEQLDELEDYYGPGQNNEYERIFTDVTVTGGHVVRGYVYIYAGGEKDLSVRGMAVPSGDWRNFFAE